MRFALVCVCAAATVAFLGGAPVTEARASRATRDAAWVPSDPDAFEVKLSFDKVGRHVTDIGMVRREIMRTAFCSLRSPSDLRLTSIRAHLGGKLAISASSCQRPRLTPRSLRLIAQLVSRKLAKD
jgi:hypothetical protein